MVTHQIIRILLLIDIVVVTLYAQSDPASTERPFKNDWSKRYLLYNIDLIRQKFPDCSHDFQKSDSLYYVKFFGQIKKLNGTPLGMVYSRNTVNELFRELSYSYLNDSLLFHEMEKNAEESFEVTKRCNRWDGISNLCGAGGSALIFSGLLVLFGEGESGLITALMATGFSCLVGSAVTSSISFVIFIKGRPYSKRMVNCGKEIIVRSNLKYLQNRCESEQ